MNQLPQNQRFAIAQKEAQTKANSTGTTYYVIFNSKTTAIYVCDRNQSMKKLDSDSNSIDTICDPEVDLS